MTIEPGEGIRTDGGTQQEPHLASETHVGLTNGVAALAGLALSFFMMMGALSYGLIPATLTVLATVGGAVLATAASRGVIRDA